MFMKHLSHRSSIVAVTFVLHHLHLNAVSSFFTFSFFGASSASRIHPRTVEPGRTLMLRLFSLNLFVAAEFFVIVASKEMLSRLPSTDVIVIRYLPRGMSFGMTTFSRPSPSL